MIKDILNSLPVLLISIAATVTGGTAVSKIAGESRPSFLNDPREVQEVRAATPTPSPIDESDESTQATTTQNSTTTIIPTQGVAQITKTTATATSASTFTLATLAQHNKNGNCYVAYKSVVYNVSAHPSWQNCLHHGTSGGKDITSLFPHSTSYFSTLPKVGTLTTSTPSTGTSSGNSTNNPSDDDEADDEVEHEDSNEDSEDEDEIEIENEVERD